MVDRHFARQKRLPLFTLQIAFDTKSFLAHRLLCNPMALQLQWLFLLQLLLRQVANYPIIVVLNVKFLGSSLERGSALGWSQFALDHVAQEDFRSEFFFTVFI
jgi:hypothetical protein